MTPFLCKTCGMQYPASGAPPAACPVCEDDRQYVGAGGQEWIARDDFRKSHSVIVADDDGVQGVGLSPAFAINQRAIIVEAEGVKVMWESLSLVTDAAIEAITASGAIDAIAISHPHFYSAMHDWSDALGGVPIYIHENDREWVREPERGVEFWRGERLALSAGVTLIRCGGHFPGSAALHWRDGRNPQGALLPGDALQVSANRRHVSFMYSYPNAIPMRIDAVRRMRRALEDCEFERVYGYTWRRNILVDGRAAVDRSFDLYFDAIGVAA